MSKTYCQELDFQFDDKLRLKLLQQAKENTFKYHQSILSKQKTNYEVCSTYDNQLSVSAEMLEAKKIITDMLCEPATMNFIRLKPKTDMVPHIDAHHTKHRNCVLLTLLAPDNMPHETRLEFYDENKNVVHTHHYTKKSLLATTDTLHNAFNETDYDRYSFQMSFTQSIKDLLEMYDSRS